MWRHSWPILWFGQHFRAEWTSLRVESIFIQWRFCGQVDPKIQLKLFKLLLKGFIFGGDHFHAILIQIACAKSFLPEQVYFLFKFNIFFSNNFQKFQRKSRIGCDEQSKFLLFLINISPIHHFSKMYGFEGEVKSKYNQKMAELFTEIFNCMFFGKSYFFIFFSDLPLCHLINKKIFVSFFPFSQFFAYFSFLGLPWRTIPGGFDHTWPNSQSESIQATAGRG